MSLLDRAKTVAGQATTKAKEGLEEVQTRRELSQAYEALGKLPSSISWARKSAIDTCGCYSVLGRTEN